jgi:ribosomal protein S14
LINNDAECSKEQGYIREVNAETSYAGNANRWALINRNDAECGKEQGYIREVNAETIYPTQVMLIGGH